MARILIVGYGNPLREDDGLGWHVAGGLRLLLEEPQVKILACHQLTPELAETMSKAVMAVFVDASSSGEPGSMNCQSIRPQVPPLSAFTHSFTPLTLLHCAEKLYGAAPEAWLFSVPGESFDIAETLSPVVAAAVPKVVEAIYCLAQRSLSQARSVGQCAPSANNRE